MSISRTGIRRLRTARFPDRRSASDCARSTVSAKTRRKRSRRESSAKAQRHSRSRVAHGRQDRHTRKARGGRCLPLDGARSPTGSVGREGARKVRRRCRCSLGAKRPSAARRPTCAPRDGAVRARRQRLPDAAPVAQGAPDEFPAGGFSPSLPAGRVPVLACAALARSLKDGARVAVAGVVLIRQRPGSAKGVVFMTIEDETGVANAVVWPKMLEAFRKVVMTARLIRDRGPHPAPRGHHPRRRSEARRRKRLAAAALRMGGRHEGAARQRGRGDASRSWLRAWRGRYRHAPASPLCP